MRGHEPFPVLGVSFALNKLPFHLRIVLEYYIVQI